jgi:predicted ABC-type ATPase
VAEGQPPKVVILAGPNGAGKSTAATRVLKGPLAVEEFVNADIIAQGLSAFSPESVALQAGRVMLARLKELAEQRKSFAFETTLASRTFAPWISALVQSGYEFHLLFLWLPNVEAALARVAERVRTGGHSVPEETIRRRYHGGLRNFLDLYRPLATTWQIVDNRHADGPRLIAIGQGVDVPLIHNPSLWHEIEKGAGS